MPWKITLAHYDALDPHTLHDDEMIAIERALRGAASEPANETNPAWRAWQKIQPLAAACTGDGDPIHLLPPEARASPIWADYAAAGPAESEVTPPPPVVRPAST